MEDLWEKVEDVDCEVCGGIYDCSYCGEIVSDHFPQYVYRILVQLAKFKIPADQLLKFVEFADERELWLRIGHWTICEACEDLWIDLKDYAIHHHKYDNANTLEVSQGRDGGQRWELVYSVAWVEENRPMTADVVGVSTPKVEQVLSTMHNDWEYIIKSVKNGEFSINKA